MMEEITINYNGQEVTLERVKATDDGGDYPVSPMRAEIVLRKLRDAVNDDDVRRVMDDSFPDCKRDEPFKIVARLKGIGRERIGGAFDDPIREKQIFDWLDEWVMGKSKRKSISIIDYVDKERLEQSRKVTLKGRDGLRKVLDILFPLPMDDYPSFKVFDKEFNGIINKTDYYIVINERKRPPQKHTKFNK